MRPLLFLTGKFLVNSVRRAMHSPSRLIGFLLLVGWWFLIVTGRLSDRQPGPAIPGGVQLDMPREAVVFSLLFPVYLMVFVMRGFSMFRVPGIFRGADSDVLFPTPIAPWKVLLHRFVIDYLITLLIPLLMLLFAGPGASRGIEFLFKNIPNPDAARWVSKLIFLAFLLVSLFGVAFSYAVALYINRDTDLARRVRRLVMGFVIALIFALGAAIALAALSEKPGTALVELASHPIVRTLAYPAAAATDLAIGPIYAHVWPAYLGLAFLAGGSILCMWIASKQAHHLYDMATRQLAAGEYRQASRAGDYGKVAVLKAQSGRLKARNIPVLGGLSLRGKWALVWKDAILHLRSSFSLLLLFTLILIAMSALALIDTKQEGRGAIFVLPMQLLMFVSLAISISQSDFLETLRRVDVQKPLPFTSWTICLMEVIGKWIPLAVMALAGGVSLLLFATSRPDIGLASILALPSVALCVVAAQWVVILAFPHYDDPAQRALRGILQFLASAFALLPALLVFALMTALGVPLLVSVIPGVIVNVGITFVLVTLAAPLYASFNPAD